MSILELDAPVTTKLGAATQTFSHRLHARSLFDDDGLAAILDGYPREKLGVYTMGDDPVEWRTWRAGSAGDLTGAEILAAVKAGRIWLNLRSMNLVNEAFEGIRSEIFQELEGASPGLKTFKHDVGLLISSPSIQVFYHLDVAPTTLWQMRGEKRMWVYPVAEPFIDSQTLERIVLRETDEQYAYDPTWDENAQIVTLTPGTMVSWPQNAPHRVANGPMMNVSLSIEHMTTEALVRANVIYANGVLRSRFGLSPRLEDGIGPTNLAKFAFARAVKASGLVKPPATMLPKTFVLDPNAPGELIAA